MAERPYIVGNWKMNGTRAMLAQARAIDRAAQNMMKVEVALAPPYTLIHAVHREVEQIGVGAQDCHPGPDGANTGDVSAAMVADAGAKFVILGHSERRRDHGETDALVAEKQYGQAVALRREVRPQAGALPGIVAFHARDCRVVEQRGAASGVASQSVARSGPSELSGSIWVR